MPSACECLAVRMGMPTRRNAAIPFVAEVGDLSGFEHPQALMSYVGMMYSEYSSGASCARVPSPSAATNLLGTSSWSLHRQPTAHTSRNMTWRITRADLRSSILQRIEYREKLKD